MRTTLALAAALALVGGCYNPDTGNIGYYCHPMDNPPCPDGTKCLVYLNPTSMRNEWRCQHPGPQTIPDLAGGLIPKSTIYSGPHTDPMLSTPDVCPDASLEPNDSPATALDAPTPTPDQPTAKITKMAICPTGPNPATGQHDVDYFKVDTTTLTSGTLNMRVDVFYDITFGDLDVGIFDQNGMYLGGDGTAVSNACATAGVQAGVYYVVVVGAQNMDTNKYDIRIRTYTTPQQCPGAAPLDMGL